MLIVVLAGLLLVPAASASHAPAVKLAIVPLPQAAIGSAAATLSLSYDSGPVSNANAALHTSSATARTFKKLGRLNGYGLEYGDAFSGGAGITDVRTSIEQYKNAADARRGLAFWKKEDSKHGQLSNPNFTVTNALVQTPVPAPKTSHFAYVTTYSASNIVPVSGVDEQIADGKFVLDVIVTAGDPSLAEALAPTLAAKLDARFRLARNRHLHAKPVKLLKQRAGRPPGGPDLSALALRESDLVGKTTVVKGYVVDPSAISDYSVFMLPAGEFEALDQEIEWYPTANEASFFADFENATALVQPGAKALDLSSLGDGAQGSVASSKAFTQGQVCFASGHLGEFIFIWSSGTIHPSNVMSVAQTAANRIDAAGLGS